MPSIGTAAPLNQSVDYLDDDLDPPDEPAPPPNYAFGALTDRLDQDEDFRKKILNLVKDYVYNARSFNDWRSADYDLANDIIQTYANVTKKEYVHLAKGWPRKYILPVTATHINTMTSFLAHALFGDQCPHKVEPGTPDAEASARVMNGLLGWNCEQQPIGMFQLGWFWIENGLTYNRGVMYDCYQSIYKWRWEEVPAVDRLTGEPILGADGVSPKMELRKVRKRVGGYCRLEIVSPYDFYTDQSFPLCRMQEGRFAGHRVNLSWNELKRRSALEKDDPSYVSPRAVKELKVKPAKSLGYPSTSVTGGTGLDFNSRTAYERNRINTPFDQRYDSKDPGMVSVAELWVRLVPKDYDIDDRTEPTLFQVLMGNEREILALNEAIYEHDMYPYMVGEPRPSAFYQWNPSWVMMLQPIQAYVDYIKDKHQEAVTRTVGNVFMARSHLIDIQDFEDPDKEGKFINILPEAGTMGINDIIRQVPVVDTTAGFLNEMKVFINFAESTSGASQGLQGSQSEGDQTATAFQSTMMNAQGRLGTIARLLSVQGLVPQTKRLVSNLQQFFDGDLVRRIEGSDLLNFEGDAVQTVAITPDTIQGEFDYRPHDGTLPGADAKTVAALSRVVEAMPIFPDVFAPGPTSINPKRVFLSLFKASGCKPEEFRWRQDEIAAAQQRGQQAAEAEAAKMRAEKEQPIKPSFAVSAKLEMLTPEERAQIMAQVHVQEPPGALPGASITPVAPNHPVPPKMPGQPGAAGGKTRPGPVNQGGPRSNPMIPPLNGAAPKQPRPA